MAGAEATRSAIGSLFSSQVDLYEIERIAPSSTMPAGWLLRMPLGGQHVTVRLWGIELGVRGAYRVALARHALADEWEIAALEALGDMVSFLVTDWEPITERLLCAVAEEFQRVWTMGSIAPELVALRGAFPTEVDADMMRWVSVRRASSTQSNI